MENVTQTIISQYGTSPRILQLIDYWNQDIDPAINFLDFFNFVWNVDTAKGFGLDIWGRIVNISRYLYVVDNYKYFGFYNPAFAPDNQVYTPFNVKPFFNGYNATPTIRVDDETYRKMILGKAYANISIPSAKTFNFILNFLFGDNAAFVIDGLDMTFRYIFNITLSPIQYAIIYQSGVMPRPAGVLVTADAGKLFGFDSGHNPTPAENFPWPFNVGVFDT